MNVSKVLRGHVYQYHSSSLHQAYDLAKVREDKIVASQIRPFWIPRNFMYSIIVQPSSPPVTTIVVTPTQLHPKPPFLMSGKPIFKCKTIEHKVYVFVILKIFTHDKLENPA